MESKPIRTGTWNVLTLREKGKLDQLVNEAQQLRLEILGLSEVRRKDYGKRRLESGYTLLHTGRDGETDGRKCRGVGFLLSERAHRALLQWELVSDRIITARFKTDLVSNLTILQVRAPTNSAASDDKKQFYHDLEVELEKVPQDDIRIVMGDLNAQIGSDNKEYEHIMGPHGVDPPDSNGPLLVKFCNTNNMLIGGSFFPHKLEDKITYEMVNGDSKKQLDHICISNEWKKCLLDVRNDKSADIGSDHLLVIGEIRLGLAEVQHGTVAEAPFDTTRLNDRNVKNSFVIELRKRAKNMPNTETVEEQWTAIKNVFISASEEILSVSGTKKEERILEPTRQKIAERKEAKAALRRAEKENKTIDEKRRCRELKKEVDLSFQSDEHDDLAAEGEKAVAVGDMKRIYEIARRLEGEEPNLEKPIKSRHGQLLTNPSEQLERLVEHFDQLLTPSTDNQPAAADRQLPAPSPPPPQVTPSSGLNSEEPSLQEIEAAIQTMECNVEPGIDRISAEMLQADPILAAQMLHPLFCTIWKTETFPADWMQGILVPIPPKEQKQTRKGRSKEKQTDTEAYCDDWRGNGRLCVGLKVLCQVILNRIQRKVDATLRREQAAYREGRSAVDHIATLRIIIEQMSESKEPLYLVFLHYEEAFNRLNHTYLWSALARKGVPDKIVNLLAAQYSAFSYRVRYNGSLSNPIRMKAGLIQDCPLSPLLFLIVIDEIMIGAIDREPKRGLPWAGQEQHLNDLSFADEIVLLSTRRTHMQSKLNDLVQYSAAAGLTIDVNKTRAMDVNKPNPSSFLIADQPIEKDGSVRYQGTVLATDGGTFADVCAKVKAAQDAFSSLKEIWRFKKMARETKIKIFKAEIKPMLLRGCETWCASAKTSTKLREFIGKCLKTLQDDADQMPIETEILERRWLWIGQTLRKSDTEICKQVLDWNVLGENRRQGRPPTNSWRRSVSDEIAQVNENMTWAGVKRRATNQERWDRFLSALSSAREGGDR